MESGTGERRGFFPSHACEAREKNKRKKTRLFYSPGKMPGGVKYPLRLIAYEQVFLASVIFFIVDNFNFFICKV